MIRITQATTLAELALFRAALGVDSLKIDYDYTGERLKPVRVVMFAAPCYATYGVGDTEWEALDDAFSRLWHREASDVRLTEARAEAG